MVEDKVLEHEEADHMAYESQHLQVQEAHHPCQEVLKVYMKVVLDMNLVVVDQEDHFEVHLQPDLAVPAAEEAEKSFMVSILSILNEDL